MEPGLRALVYAVLATCGFVVGAAADHAGWFVVVLILYIYTWRDLYLEPKFGNGKRTCCKPALRNALHFCSKAANYWLNSN